MLPEEKMYLPKEVIQLDDLFDRVSGTHQFFKLCVIEYVKVRQAVVAAIEHGKPHII